MCALYIPFANQKQFGAPTKLTTSATRRKTKKCPIIPKSCPKRATTVFFLKSAVFNMSSKAPKYLGYFLKKICHQEFSKIAQSGRTAFNQCDQ